MAPSYLGQGALPRDGVIARFQTWDGAPDAYELREAGGAPLDLELTAEGQFTIYRPVSLLVAGRQYEVLLGGEVVSTFEVDDRLAVTPPPRPSAAVVGPYADEMETCGSTLGVQVAVEPGGLMHFISIGEDDPGALPEVSLATYGHAVASVVSAGRGFCSNSNWIAEADATTSVRVAYLSEAGEFSAWSDPIEVTMPPDPPDPSGSPPPSPPPSPPQDSGCAQGSSTNGGGTPAVVAALLLVLFARLRTSSSSRVALARNGRALQQSEGRWADRRASIDSSLGTASR
jgi:hypothetical protein